MKGKRIPKVVLAAASLAVLGGVALAAQDRYTLRIPNGLAFSELTLGRMSQ
ncbi:MAG: hypothetical protein WAU56_13580 [Steroidobacteraceae bacterium]